MGLRLKPLYRPAAANSSSFSANPSRTQTKMKITSGSGVRAERIEKFTASARR